MPYWFGAYGSIVDGCVELEVMSAWRKVKYAHSDNAKWVETFEYATNGRIDVAIVVIA